MSLILEALKKSEQQRRLGEAPTLGSPVVATRRRRNLLPVLAILILIAGAAGWWLTRRAPPPPAPPVVSETAKPVAAQPAKPMAKAPPAPARTVPPAPAVAKEPGKGGTLVPDNTAQRREARAEKVEALKRAAATATPPGTSLTTAGVPKPATPPATAKPGTAPPAAPKPLDAGTAAPAAATAAPKPADKAAPAAGDKAVAPVAAVAKPAAAVATLPSIFDLPYATRKDLPAIDLTMHVYSSDPASRFVVIKGDRHVEGDELGQDLILREIRQDGLVLEFKGQRFLFPRSGR